MTHPRDVEPAGLKPCPFGCKLPPVNCENHDRCEMYWVLCPNCHASPGSRATRAEAITAWNTRASPSPSGDVREAMQVALAGARAAIASCEPWTFGAGDCGGLSDPYPIRDELLYMIDEALSKADMIAALYVERIGVGVSQSQPCTDGAQPVLKEPQHSDGEG